MLFHFIPYNIFQMRSKCFSIKQQHKKFPLITVGRTLLERWFQGTPLDHYLVHWPLWQWPKKLKRSYNTYCCHSLIDWYYEVVEGFELYGWDVLGKCYGFWLIVPVRVLSVELKHRFNVTWVNIYRLRIRSLFYKPPEHIARMAPIWQ